MPKCTLAGDQKSKKLERLFIYRIPLANLCLGRSYQQKQKVTNMPAALRKTEKEIKLTPATDVGGVYKLADLEGLDDDQLVLERDCVTYSDSEPRLIKWHVNTWRRKQRSGDMPPREELFGRPAIRVKHLRAIATGGDWRSA